MTPKEKAENLVDSFFSSELFDYINIEFAVSKAKEYALIAVDEMIYENNLHLSFFLEEKEYNGSWKLNKKLKNYDSCKPFQWDRRV